MQDSSYLNWDRKLNIATEDVDYTKEDRQNYGYDPTPYAVLEELVNLNMVNKEDVLVDYGCGKGRVGFFINSRVGCKVIGIDHSEKLLEMADENLNNYGNGKNVRFIHAKAEEYLPEDANRFYFFNPFSTRIFRQVLERIDESCKSNPREILIFFYYSTIEYKLYLPTEPHLELIKTIDFTAEQINDSHPAKLSAFMFKPLAKD